MGVPRNLGLPCRVRVGDIVVGVPGGESGPGPTFCAMCNCRFVGLIAIVAMNSREICCPSLLSTRSKQIWDDLPYRRHFIVWGNPNGGEMAINMSVRQRVAVKVSAPYVWISSEESSASFGRLS